ncbi:MAG: hypothetical protein OCD00_17595 [Colwellia sp.]
MSVHVGPEYADVLYSNASERSKILKLVRNYEDLRDEHDEFCNEINKKLSNFELLKFYGTSLNFVPKDTAN